MKTLIARQGYEAISKDEQPLGFALKGIVDVYYTNSPFLANVNKCDKLIGILTANGSKKRATIDIALCHSTRHMCIGYSTSQLKCGKAYFSFIPDSIKEGESSAVWAKSLSLKAR
jgi:hypothetical protein